MLSISLVPLSAVLQATATRAAPAIVASGFSVRSVNDFNILFFNKRIFPENALNGTD